MEEREQIHYQSLNNVQNVIQRIFQQIHLNKKNLFYKFAGIPVFLREKNDNILLVKRKYNPAKGHYIFKVLDPGEHGENCAVREIKEETNLNMNESDFKFHFSLSNTYPYSDFRNYYC